MSLNESIVEDAALEWFGELGYAVGHGPHLAPGEPAAERESFGEVVLVGRLRAAIWRMNPAIPEEAREEALRKVLRVGTPSLTQTNRAFHRMLRDGVPVEYPRPDGSIAGDYVRLVDFGEVRANDWLAVNQFTVAEGQHNRRPDIVVFLNGLPLGLIELKNAADEDATIWSAYAQLQTYKAEIASLLHYNAALVVSDGLQARMGSVTANQEWFKVWRTIDGEGDAPKTALELEVLVRGVFERQRFLDLLHHFIVFEEDPDSGALHKIIAGYHQFHAVNAAVEETVRASGMTETGSVLREDAGTYWSGRQRGGKPGDRRAGVVWHTQGSGKSFSMLFFAARVVRHPAMQNPTLVVLTDRNDLDDQLFGQFQRCADSGEKLAVEEKQKPALSIPVINGQYRLMLFNEYDPACGSGGMFVQSEKFVESHGGVAKCEVRSASVEVKTTLPFVIRNSSFDIPPGPEHANTFRRDLHPDLRADYVLANPRFNDSDWFRKDDDVRFFSLSASNGERAGVRCRNDLPPKGNANFAHGSMSSNQSGDCPRGAHCTMRSTNSQSPGRQRDIRRALIEADREMSSDEMRTTNRVIPTSTFEIHPSNFASLPGQLFYSTQIPVCLWFLAKNKNADANRHFRDRSAFKNDIALAA